MARTKHSLSDDMSLFLELADPITGLPLTGQSPTLTIRRFKDPHGALLDGYYWDGVSAFQAAPISLAMVEQDATNNPGLYYNVFTQSLVRVETEYLVDYTVAAGPVAGMHDVEVHVVTAEAFLPAATSEGSPFDPDGVLP